MKYCDVWLRGVKGIFSWHTENDISVGARVVVRFRGRKKGGLVVRVSEVKPEFPTKAVEEIWDEDFVDPRYIELAQQIADENFSNLEKGLSLMVPEKFFATQFPEKRDIFYILQDREVEVRGEKQKLALDMLHKANGKISAEILREKVSLATVKSLIEKGILKEERGEVSDIFAPPTRIKENFDLTPTQQKAFDEIVKSDKPCLLFGVTGSGKTEIYKKLAKQILDEDETSQVLFLLPEIALTPQLIAEFHALFGGQIAVWHSQLSEGEKVQEWARLHYGQARILIGARSAVLVPLRNPKLIILDEEHEWTFKNEFSPRFQTHDVVEFIEHIFCSRLIFGTATPRLESLEKCQKNEWKRVNLTSRVHEVQLPEIDLVDLKNEAKKGNFGPLSEPLIAELAENLKRQKQAVIFLNKRGFSGSTMCRSCGHTFHCPNCSNNMKMHQKVGDRKFICHVCGHMEKFPVACPECGIDHFVFRGWGTQMVEEALGQVFPQIRILRADADSITGKHDFEKLMDKFHAGEADVLLGTQMVAKGLDFENVDLVGVILADVGLSLPDFRSEERVFQLLTQVSGRAGRRQKRGKIIIQTFHPDEKVFEFVRHHDSEGFLNWQSEIRAQTAMPPFSTIAKLTISDDRKEKAFAEAKRIYEILKGEVLRLPSVAQDDSETWDCHMAPAFFPRTHGKYHFHVFVRAPHKKELIEFLKKQKHISAAKIDVGPISLL